MSEQPQEQQGEQDPVAPLAARLAELKQDDPDTPEPEAEPTAQQGAPAEGYDAERGVFVKQYNLAVPELHLLGADQLAEHSQTASLPDAAARAAREQGYAPTGPAQFVYGAPDGDKSAISLAVPVAPRGAPPTAEQAPAPTGD